MGQFSATITVIPVNDSESEGDETVVLTLTDGADYDLGTPSFASVTIEDNDTPDVTITQTGGSTDAAEGGATDTYDVVLNSKPTAYVTITGAPDGQVWTNKSTLTFTPDDWNVPQTVTVSAVDDSDFEGFHTGMIDHSATSSDNAYQGISISSLTVQIADNDCPTLPSASFSYASAGFCNQDDKQKPTAGKDAVLGRFSADNQGLVIDELTGEIDIENSTPGTYEVTNTLLASGALGDLLLTGVIDGPLSGGTPKAVELYVIKDIPDLSIYSVKVAPNGGTNFSATFSLTGSASAGQYLYLATEASAFNSFFGFDPNFTNSSVPNINGDDVIGLFKDTDLIDQIGELGVDGTGKPWEYTDGWAYRKSNGLGPDGGFILGNWTFSGVDALDGETTNANATNKMPIGTFKAVSGCPNQTATFTVTIVDCPEPTIDDPCTCENSPSIQNGLFSDEGIFSETVTVNGPTGQTWTVTAVTGLFKDNLAMTLFVSNVDVMTETAPGSGVFKLKGYHKDGLGYTLSVSNGRGTTLSINNTCYFPNPGFTGLPELVSPNAAPFTVTGKDINSAAGDGQFIFNTVPQGPMPTPAPNTISLAPKNLSQGTHTLAYRFDAGPAGSNAPNNPGCAVTVEQTFQVAACGCSRVNVTLDPQTCTYALEAKNLMLGNCEAATVRVVDNNPSNGNIIDCAGEWTYGLFDGLGNLICWGKVVAEDKSAPVYTSWIGKCNVGTLAVPGQTELLNGQFTNSTAAFLCLNAEELFNKEQTWKDATSALFAGRPVFVDACHNDYCKCFTTLKATDELTYFTCDEIGSTYPGVPSGYEAWARLKRTFTATDCYGNFVQGYQHIYLVRPQAVTFGNELLKSLKYQVAQASCDTIVEDYDADKNCCGEVDYELDLACLVGGDKCAAPTAEEMLRLFKTKLRIQDSLDCVTDRGYAFFAEGADSKYKLLGCNYSFDAQVVNTFPVCGNGKKVLVKLSYFDWCNPQEEHGLENCTYVLLKWYDTQAPEFTDVRKVKYEEPERMCKDDFAMAQNVPVSVISTGAMDCTASVFTDRAGLLEYLGWEIKDNCDGNPSVSVLKMERWGLEYAYGIPLSADSCWYEETYQVMVVGGRPVVTGLAPGLYRFTVEAFDHCYNKATKALYFRVVDKIAPVMKCDDQLNITLSNAQGAGYGQQYPTQGYNYYGYARVNKEDVDEGSWDNCGMERIKLRRSYDAACQADFLAKGYGKGANGDGDDLIEAGVDGWDENGDGTLQDHEKFVSVTRSGVTAIMTPWLDYAEFFCCDLGNKVVVELGGWDKSGNFSYCWSEQLIEDKVLPTYILPWPVTIGCTDRAWVEGF
ncbi:MAG: hypothetical protein IPK21_11285 [Haliscomenobacter sp.]|nr:hypothetical protein [Haliscomenobacter sp.]